MKNRAILLTALLGFMISFLPFQILADDSYIEVYGGAAKMREPGATEVAMKSETVRITLGKETYHVDATFEFYNYGKTVTLTVGFPQTIMRNATGKARLLNFKTWVNGNQIEFRELPAVVEIDGKEYGADQIPKEYESTWFLNREHWLVKKVTFPSQQKTITRVVYDAPYGHTSGTGPGFVYYLYGTGRPWKGNIEEARFIIKTNAQAWLFPIELKQLNRYSFVRLADNEFEYALKDFKPAKDDMFQFWASSANEPWQGYNEWDLKALDYCDTQYSDTIVPDQVLSIMTLRQLRLFRNSYYAQHGKIFSEPDLDSYFKTYKCYNPSKDFQESDLSAIEKANIKKISEYEKKLSAELNNKKN